MANRIGIIDFLLSPSTQRAGGSVTFYETGTSSYKNVYGASDKTDPKSIASFNAVGTVSLWGEGVYDIVIKNSSGQTLGTILGYQVEKYVTNVVTKIQAYQITNDDDVVLCNANAAGFTVTLPDATTISHGMTIRKIDGTTNAVTVTTLNSQTIDGVGTATLDQQSASLQLYSDGSNWHGINNIINAATATNADTVDNYHAGNSGGQVAVSNSTLCSTLNADLLDGYHAGNSTGQVPVSNGTVCTNLYADRVKLRAVRVYRNTTYTQNWGILSTGERPFDWTHEQYDTDNTWAVGQPGKIVVPATTNHADIDVQLNIGSITNRSFKFYLKVASASYVVAVVPSSFTGRVNFSIVVPVSQGDEMGLYMDSIDNPSLSASLVYGDTLVETWMNVRWL